MAHGFKNDIFLALVYHLTEKDSDPKTITTWIFSSYTSPLHGIFHMGLPLHGMFQTQKDFVNIQR